LLPRLGMSLSYAWSAPSPERYYHTTGNRGDHLRSQRSSAECWIIVRDSKLNSSARAEGGKLLPASLARDCRFMQKRKIALCAFSFLLGNR
jgi:hypothetical protein